MLSEIRRAWRSLLRRKAYFFTCSATLALVLGANAAMFAVANATLVRPMPFAASGTVVHVFSQPPGTTSALQRNPLQQMEVPRLREGARSFARLEGFYPFERVVTLAGEPTVAQGAAVTPGLLGLLAAPVAQGRAFLAEEGAPGPAVAVVSDAYWRDALGSRPVLGTSLVIDDQPHTIVGVLSPKFAVPFLDAQVLTPLVASPEAKARAPVLTVVGLAELLPGVSLRQAQAELTAISARLAQEFPRTHAHWTLGLEPAREWQYGSMRAPLVMLLVATGFVLLIACVNIANLTTAQAIARSGEVSLRLALGASRSHVLRVIAAELLLVCAVGLVPGLLLARAAVPALLAVHPTIAATLGRVTIDWRVQALSGLVAALTAVAAAALPALRATRESLASPLTGSRGSALAPGVSRAQRTLVSAEVALCVGLLIASGVVIQGLRDLARRGPGYEAAGVLTAQIRLPEASYPTPERRVAVVNELLDEIRALPGVVSVGTTQNAFLPKFSYQTLIRVQDRPTPDDQPHTVQYRRVSPDYFKTMRIPALQGRVFSDEDTADRPPVVVVSRAFAELLMPGLDPVGRVLLRNNPPPVTVVGVVEDASDVTAAERAEPTLYVAWSQNNNFGVPVAFVIRTSIEPAALVPSVRERLRRVDASLPLRKAEPLDVFVRDSTAPERFRALVLGLLALLGLLLAAVGISGVTYRSVVDRTRDFAVRLALGSQPRGLVRMVLAESARDVATGAAAGLAAGVAAALVLAHALPNVGRFDLVTAATVLAIVALIGLVAAIVPAVRVSRLDPARVLRG
jgi:predicted permease